MVSVATAATSRAWNHSAVAIDRPDDRPMYCMHVAEAQHVGERHRRPAGGEALRHAEARHLPGAHQHDVAGLDRHPGQRAGGVEIGGRDGVAAVEDVESLWPGPRRGARPG